MRFAAARYLLLAALCLPACRMNTDPQEAEPSHAVRPSPEADEQDDEEAEEAPPRKPTKRRCSDETYEVDGRTYFESCYCKKQRYADVDSELKIIGLGVKIPSCGDTAKGEEGEDLCICTAKIDWRSVPTNRDECDELRAEALGIALELEPNVEFTMMRDCPPMKGEE